MSDGGEWARCPTLAIVLLLMPVAYLIGTFPSASSSAAARASTSPPRARGTPGASNTFRLLGWKAGAVVFALDFAKGALAAGVGIVVDGHLGAYMLGGAAIIGHTLPITRKFKGGRGVATGAGVVFVIFPLLRSGWRCSGASWCGSRTRRRSRRSR